MKLSIVSVLLMGGGSVCIYGAVKDRNPIDVIKVVLEGKGPHMAMRLSTGKRPDPIDISTPDGGIIGTPLVPGMPGYVPPKPGTPPTRDDWEPGSPFPPGFPGA